MFLRPSLVYLCFILSSFLFAQEPVNTDKDGVLLNGYDVVAYFNSDEAQKGSAQWQAEYRDVTLYFSSQENLDLFLKFPEKYWPQYSGHCANGLSDGHLVRANPEIYRIIDDRLYLFFSWWGKAQWKFDQADQIHIADQNWRHYQSGSR